MKCQFAGVLISFLSLLVSSQKPKCGSGLPCIFVNREIGWIARNESPTQPVPPPIRTNSWKLNTTKIFIAISSFRDKLCPITLFNMYTKATYPHRLYTAVIQQNIPGDLDCYEEYCRLMKVKDLQYPNPLISSTASSISWECPFSQNIQMKRLDGNTARGPTWARSFANDMIHGEFCLQTDSHMDYEIGWDKLMLDMWGAINNEYGILSTYVTDSTDFYNIKDHSKGINNLHEVPHLCIVLFHGMWGMPRNFGTKCLRMFPKPKLTNAVWGAGLSFSKCHAERKVPYDPFTPGIFDGEEWSRAARFWTYGYDIYTPHRVYISHNYKGSQSDPTHGAWHSSGLGFKVTDSVERLRLLLHMNPAENVTLGERLRRSKYGLGDRRTFAQLMEFSGVDPIHKSTLRDRCGNIEYVPFKEHPLGPDYIPRFDEVTFDPLDEPDEGSIYYQPPASGAIKARSPEEKEKIFEKKNYLINNMKEKEALEQEEHQTMSMVVPPPLNRISPGVPQRVIVSESHRIPQQQLQGKNINENIWFDILMELSLFFIILIGCYYCTMLPSRSTKNL